MRHQTAACRLTSTWRCGSSPQVSDDSCLRSYVVYQLTCWLKLCVFVCLYWQSIHTITHPYTAWHESLNSFVQPYLQIAKYVAWTTSDEESRINQYFTSQCLKIRYTRWYQITLMTDLKCTTMYYLLIMSQLEAQMSLCCDPLIWKTSENYN